MARSLRNIPHPIGADMRSLFRGVTLCAAALLLAAGAGAPARATGPLLPDSGKFDILIQSVQVGQVTFDSSADGGGHSQMVVSLGGRNVTVDVTFKSSAGALHEIDTAVTPANAKYTAVLNGSKVTLSATAPKPSSQTLTLPPKWFLLSVNMPQTFEAALADYDTGHHSGPQTYTFFMLDSGTLGSGTIADLGTGTATVA